MTQVDDRPDILTEPGTRPGGLDELGPRREQPPAGRIAATVLLLVGVTLVAAVVGYMLAGGRLPGRSQRAAEGPATAVAT